MKGPQFTSVVRNFAISSSLANLSYLRTWDLLLHKSESGYYSAEPYNSTDYLAAIAGVFLLTLGFYWLLSFAWKHDHRWLRIAAAAGVLGALIFPFDFVRRWFGFSVVELLGSSWLVILVPLFLILNVLAFRFRRICFSALLWLLGVFSPYVLFNIGHALYLCVASGPSGSPVVSSAFPAPILKNSAQRLLWIVFDEWDQTALFVRRPSDLKLPVLDALVEESVVANQAFAPAKMTRVSIPALLTGRLIENVAEVGDSELSIRFRGEGKWSSFREQETIVTDALRTGYPAAVLGWNHPYRRILPKFDNLTSESYGSPAYDAIHGVGIIGSMLSQYAFLANPFYIRMVSRDLYVKLHADSLRTVSDPKFRFIFLHYGVPHLPGLYDVKREEMSVMIREDTSGYSQNLALVDRTLGELLVALERAGLRDSTSLILTSDHWWRSAPWVKPLQGHPVPLIIQIKRGDEPRQVDASICTISLRELANAIMNRQLLTNGSVANYLSSRSVEDNVSYINGIIEFNRPRI